MSGLHLVPVSSCLGDPVPLESLTDDDGVRDHLDELRDQGLVTARVSTADTARLAAEVTPAGTDLPVVLASSDSTGEDGPTEWVLRYRAEAGLPGARVLFVGGEACANVVAAVDTAAGLVAAGRARTVLWVTADRVTTPTRFPSLSTTVFSDGAASCLITADPPGRSFEVLGTATRSWPDAGPGTGTMAHARTTLTAAREVARELDPPAPGIAHLVTPNFGSATRRMLAMAVPVPLDRLHPGCVAEVGHCFAADTVLNLERLQEEGPADGALVLALSSGRTTMSGMLLRYRSTAGDRGLDGADQV